MIETVRRTWIVVTLWLFGVAIAVGFGVELEWRFVAYLFVGANAIGALIVYFAPPLEDEPQRSGKVDTTRVRDTVRLGETDKERKGVE